MAAEPETSPQPRIPLTRDRVLRAAIRIADEEGLDALTMRRLGQELGVQAMSLYNHVANKDDLYQGIVDLAMSEIEVPSDASGLEGGAPQSAISAYQAFVRHPWACNLHMATPRINDDAHAVDGRRAQDAARGRLLAEHDAPRVPRARQPHHRLHAVDREHALRQPRGAARHGGGVHSPDPGRSFPYVIEHAKEHLEDPDPNEPSEFEFGLDLILEGLERRLDAA